MSPTPASSGRRVLVLYWYEPFTPLRPTIRQHIRLFEAGGAGHRVHYFNVALGMPRSVRATPFDLIVLHTTLLCARWFAQFPRVRERLGWLADSPAFKVALPQDEYDYAGVLDEWLAELRVNLVGTNFDARHRPLLYPTLQSQARFVEVLTGYIDEATAKAVFPTLRPAAERPLDLVYRANRLPYWFGSHGQLKWEIADRVEQAAADLGLMTDISTRPEHTIQSDQWYPFLASSRATIGCESGSSVLDTRGEIQATIRRMLAAEPGLSFEQVSARMPANWDRHRFFAIGPRHLEAVMTRTCQVLVEGEYDGILGAGRHYIPIRRDFANLGDALAMVRDSATLDQMTQRAFEDVFLQGQYTYAAVSAKLDAVIGPRPTAVAGSDTSLRVRLRLAALALTAKRLPRRALGLVKRAIKKLIRPVPPKVTPR